jgi:hypothetical protein
MNARTGGPLSALLAASGSPLHPAKAAEKLTSKVLLVIRTELRRKSNFI